MPAAGEALVESLRSAQRVHILPILPGVQQLASFCKRVCHQSCHRRRLWGRRMHRTEDEATKTFPYPLFHPTVWVWSHAMYPYTFNGIA